MELNERIKQRRKELGFTQLQVAEKLGVTRPSIGYWEQGKTEPTGRLLHALAKILETSSEWLVTGKSAQTSIIKKGNTTIKWLPIITSVQAGNFTDNMNYDDFDYIPYFERCSDNSFCMKVEGDSMDSGDNNALKEGSIVIVDRDRIPNNGDIVVAKLSYTNEATIKKYIRDAGQTYLKPLNPTYPIINVDKPMDIVGVVVGSMLYRRY